MLFEDADEALRALLWRRFAVMTLDGPVLCTRELHRKIVFDEEQAAWGCARELIKLDGVKRYVHPCGTHWHLTRKAKEEPDVTSARTGTYSQRFEEKYGVRRNQYLKVHYRKGDTHREVTGSYHRVSGANWLHLRYSDGDTAVRVDRITNIEEVN